MAVVDQKRPTITSILSRCEQLHITLFLSLNDEGEERLVVEADNPATITEQARRAFSERESELIAHLRAEYEEHAAQAEIDMAMEPLLCAECLDAGQVVIASEEPAVDDMHYCHVHTPVPRASSCAPNAGGGDEEQEHEQVSSDVAQVLIEQCSLW